MMTLIRMLTLMLLMILTAMSYCGIFIPMTYEKETPSLIAQGVGQDWINLGLIVPAGLILLIRLRQNRLKELILLGGLMLYVFYSSVIYCFGLHFNFLFLWYCAALGTGFYVLILIMTEIHNREFVVKHGHGLRIFTALFLSFTALVFYGLWLQDIFPAILKNTMPVSAAQYHLPVNPVHVIDLAVVLPGLLIITVLYLKKMKTGNLLAPMALVFIACMALAISAMVVVMKFRHFEGHVLQILAFILAAFVSLVLLFLLLGKIKKPESYRLYL